MGYFKEEPNIEIETNSYHLDNFVIDIVRNDNKGQFFSKGGFGIVWKNKQLEIIEVEEFYKEEDLELMEIGAKLFSQTKSRNADLKKELRNRGEII